VYYLKSDWRKGIKEYYPLERIENSDLIMHVNYEDYKTVKKPRTKSVKTVVGYVDSSRGASFHADRGTDIPIYAYHSVVINGEYDDVLYYAVWLDLERMYQKVCRWCECEICIEEQIKEKEDELKFEGQDKSIFGIGVAQCCTLI
jgi:hypothetical protein